MVIFSLQFSHGPLNIRCPLIFNLKNILFIYLVGFVCVSLDKVLIQWYARGSQNKNSRSQVLFVYGRNLGLGGVGEVGVRVCVG